MKKLIAIIALLASVCYGAYNYIPYQSAGEFVDWGGYKLWVASDTENTWLDPNASSIINRNEMNESASAPSVFVDDAPAGNNLHLTNMPTAGTGITGGNIAGTNENGVVTYYGDLDKVNDYGTWGSKTLMQSGGFMSISMWIKPDDIITAGNQYFYRKRNNIWYGVITGAGVLGCGFTTAGGTASHAVSEANCNWKTNDWNFVCVTRQWTNYPTAGAIADRTIIYVNEFTDSGSGTGQGFITGSTEAGVIGQNLGLGSLYGGGMRDITFYDIALTGLQVTNLMNNTHPTNNIRVLE